MLASGRRLSLAAETWGLVHRNVAALAEGPSVRKAPIHPLTLAQAWTLLETAKGHRLETLILVALTTGLREGELLGLRWPDVALDRCVVHVRNQVQIVDGTPRLVPVKTEGSSAAIPLSGGAVASLGAH